MSQGYNDRKNSLNKNYGNNYPPSGGYQQKPYIPSRSNDNYANLMQNVQPSSMNIKTSPTRKESNTPNPSNNNYKDKDRNKQTPQNKASNSDPRKDRSRLERSASTKDEEDQYDVVAKRLKTEDLSNPRNLLNGNKTLELSNLMSGYLNIMQRIEFPGAEIQKRNFNYKDKLAKNIPGIKPNFIILNSVATTQNEFVQNNSNELFDIPVSLDPLTLNKMKVSFIEEIKIQKTNTQNDIASLPADSDISTKIISLNSQTVYQANPKLYELEDKLEKLEHLYRDKLKLNSECDKKIHFSTLEVVRAKLNLDICDQRINDIIALKQK